jgi:hypothetical protein
VNFLVNYHSNIYWEFYQNTKVDKIIVFNILRANISLANALIRTCHHYHDSIKSNRTLMNKVKYHYLALMDDEMQILVNLFFFGPTTKYDDVVHIHNVSSYVSYLKRGDVNDDPIIKRIEITHNFDPFNRVEIRTSSNIFLLGSAPPRYKNGILREYTFKELTVKFKQEKLLKDILKIMSLYECGSKVWKYNWIEITQLECEELSQNTQEYQTLQLIDDFKRLVQYVHEMKLKKQRKLRNECIAFFIIFFVALLIILSKIIH